MSEGSRVQSGPIGFAQRVALTRLDDHPAWPMSALQLECELAGIYQNTSGRALQMLHEDTEIGRKRINVNGGTRTYFTRVDDPLPDPEDEILDAAQRFEQFLTDSGHFANLVTYVALSKIHNELSSHITGFDVLPEGPHPYLLNNPGREPDGAILLPDEHVPVEVYNGGDYLGTNTRKYRQLTDLSSDPEDGIPTNPMLVNRRSDDEIKREVRRMNGMVIDTDYIVACENKQSEIEDALDTLHLTRRIEFLPEVETADGVILDGEAYDALSISTNDVNKVRPPSKMLPAADNLPEQLLKRIRGGVQLQYVNSIYREGHERMRQDACLVLQAIYNLLLREGGHDRRTALERGWQNTTDHYTRLKSAEARKDAILDETGSLLNRLQDEHIITVRNGEMHARKAEHPQQHLTF